MSFSDVFLLFSCRFRTCFIEHTLNVILGRVPRIQKNNKRMDPRVKPEDDVIKKVPEDDIIKKHSRDDIEESDYN